MNDDTEFQELIRAEFLLPYLTNEFLRIYAKENAGGLLFAFLKDNGRLRPMVPQFYSMCRGLAGWSYHPCPNAANACE